MKPNLSFDKGTIILEGLEESIISKIDFFSWDERVLAYRAPAFKYRQIVMFLRSQNIFFVDSARKFSVESFCLKKKISPRFFQKEAINAWIKEKLGVVSLPTGSGKTILSVMLIDLIRRPTLIHVPTIDLMRQWKNILTQYFKIPIGLLGGGINEIKNITVATYDSALIHVENKGNQFGFLIFDECHHLPGENFQFTAISSIAPFRLGLSATPERSDGKESSLFEICGPICYEKHIDQLSGETLAPYEVKTIEVEMRPEDRKKYESARDNYINFIKKAGINFQNPSGWKIFLKRTSESAEGRDAFKSYMLQKKMSQASVAKEEIIWNLFLKHKGDRILIFTQDNEMAYRIGRNFLLPVITHHTRFRERELFLKAFKSGDYPVLITSKVLNEGVDVPEANVAIIVSGSGSIREHVQRLGRILRARPGKKSILYELVSKDTGEFFINKRRRKHRAYEGASLFSY